MRHAHFNPMKRLILEALHAARYTELAAIRQVAAREADRIPQTRAEQFHTIKGRFAREARALMRELPDADGARRVQIAADLRTCADILQSESMAVTHEAWLGRRKSA